VFPSMLQNSNYCRETRKGFTKTADSGNELFGGLGVLTKTARQARPKAVSLPLRPHTFAERLDRAKLIEGQVIERVD
jgi:hypothetical protein